MCRRGLNDEAVRVLCDFYDRPKNDPKVVNDAEGIFRAIELDSLRGEYKWSQLLKKDEIQTGRRVLLAYGLQFINQMGGVNMIVVSSYAFPQFEPSFMSNKHAIVLCHTRYINPGFHDLWALTNKPLVLEVNVGLDPKTSLLLGGVIQIMFVIGKPYLLASSSYVIPQLFAKRKNSPTTRLFLSDFLL